MGHKGNFLFLDRSFFVFHSAFCLQLNLSFSQTSDGESLIPLANTLTGERLELFLKSLTMSFTLNLSVYSCSSRFRHCWPYVERIYAAILIVRQDKIQPKISFRVSLMKKIQLIFKIKTNKKDK